MQKDDFNIGGEQSGHLIFREHSTTGDGIIAALQVLNLMARSNQPLSSLRQCLKKYPQAQRHLRIKERRPLDILCKEIPLIQEVEKKLDGQGRLLIRYSGTEPLLRLLIEGRDERVINAMADQLIEQLSIILG